MRCVNIDVNNRKRFYACDFTHAILRMRFYACITFDAITRKEKTQVNNVHCCKLAITQKFDKVTNCLYPNG